MPDQSWRFDALTFDTADGRLLRDGRPVRLQAQPARLLALLLEAEGEVVSHDAIRHDLWSEGTHVDFDGSLHAAVHKLRTALGPQSERIQNVPGRGYRFAPAAQRERLPAATPSEGRRARRIAAIGVAFLAAWLAAGGSVRVVGRPVVAVLPLANASEDTLTSDVVQGLDHTIASALAECGSLRVASTTSARALRGRSAAEIGSLLGVAALLEGSVSLRDGSLHITARLIDAGTESSLWSGHYRRRWEDASGEAVARAIAQNVKFTLLRPGEPAPASAAPDPWPSLPPR